MQAIFVEARGASIQNVFSTMMQLKVGVGGPIEKKGAIDSEVAATIRMSGEVEGWVALCFPIGTARRCVAALSGQDIEPASPDFADALGEIANMVCGGAKVLLANHQAFIACPSVVLGWKHAPAPGQETVIIPCSTAFGDLSIIFSIQSSKAGGSKRAA